MSTPSQEYLDFLASGFASGTLNETQLQNYQNALNNNRYSVDQIVSNVSPLEQSQAYVDQGYGGEDIRNSATSAPNGSYYGQPQNSYNVQDVQQAAQAILSSGQQLQDGNKFYDTGNPAINEALYGADIANNLGTDGTAGFRTPRQFDTNYAAEFLAAIPGTVAGAALGGALTPAFTGLLGATGGGAAAGATTAAATGLINNGSINGGDLATGAIIGAIPGLTQAAVNALPDSVIDAIGAVLPSGGPTGPLDPSIIINLAAENPELASALGSVPDVAGGLYNIIGQMNELGGGGNNTIQIPNADGSYTEIPVTDPGGGVRPQPDEGGGGGQQAAPSSNDSQTPAQGTTEPLEGTNEDVWIYNGSGELVNVHTDERREVPNPSGLIVGQTYNGDAEIIGQPNVQEPAEGTNDFTLGNVLETTIPQNSVAYDPDAVFGSNDPNIDPRTGEPYVDYTPNVNNGGLSTGGLVDTGGTGTGTDTGNGSGTNTGNGSGDGTGDGDGDGDGNTNLTQQMFGGMLGGGGGQGNYQPFMTGINYAPQMQQRLPTNVTNYLAALFGGR